MGYKKYFLFVIFIVIIGSSTYFYFGYKKDTIVLENKNQNTKSIIESTKAIPFSALNGKGRLSELPSQFITDSKIVYFIDTTISGKEILTLDGIDPVSFKAISYEYGTDGTRVFYKNKAIVGADPASFYVNAFCGYTAMDNKHVYSGGVIYSNYQSTTPPSKVGKTFFPGIGDC